MFNFLKNSFFVFFLIFLGLLIGFYFVNLKQIEADTGCQDHSFIGYAWSSNIGWISFSCRDDFDLGSGFDYGVNVIDKTLSGYTWSSNIGWVSFEEESVSGCPGGGNCLPRIEESGLDENKLVGWARVCSVFESDCSGALKDPDKRGGFSGWINFDDVEIDRDGNVSGWAWGGGGSSLESAVIGWVNLNGLIVDYLFSYTPEMELLINNNLSYCNLSFKDHPYLKVEWEYKSPDEFYNQTAYQIQIYDASDSLVYDSGEVEGISRGFLIHKDDDGNGYFNYNDSYRARIKTWTDNSVSDWSDYSEFYVMPQHHYPMISFNWNPYQIEAEQDIEFTDNTTIYGGLDELENRLWEFGADADPNQSDQQIITVIFEKGGNRDISLEIEDKTGYLCKKIEPIRVQYPLPEWKEVSPFGE